MHAALSGMRGDHRPWLEFGFQTIERYAVQRIEKSPTFVRVLESPEMGEAAWR